MQVQRVANQNNHPPIFGMNFKVSKQTIEAAERSTKVTYEEMKTLSLSELEELMIKRGSFKKPSKLKTWLANQYRKLGEALGLLEKQYDIYTDID